MVKEPAAAVLVSYTLSFRKMPWRRLIHANGSPAHRSHCDSGLHPSQSLAAFEMRW